MQLRVISFGLALGLTTISLAATNPSYRGFNEVAEMPTFGGPGLAGRPDMLPSLTKLAQRASESLSIDVDFQLRASGSDVFGRNASSVVKVLTDEGEGSGVLLQSTGLLLTNWHVIDGFSTVGVRLFPVPGSETARKTYIADVLRYDAIADLALVQIRNPPSNLAYARGASNLPPVGADVHAIGHPKGQDWSYTRGYVSQIRDNFAWQYGEGTSHQAQVVQTQTPINPGNSGGPLFDDAGALVGVNSFGDPQAQGLNYAVSINEVSTFLRRSENRMAQHVKSPGEAPRIMRVIDENGNGRPDGQILDVNGNGVQDILQVDENEDGKIDIVFYDTDEDGKFNGWIAETVLDGRKVIVDYIDSNQDGEAESVGVDLDRDGEMDEIVSLADGL